MKAKEIQTITENNLLEYYKHCPSNLGCVRSGLSDAAHLIDAIAKDITYESCSGGRRPRKEIQSVLNGLERAAQAIWNFCDKIQTNEYSVKEEAK